MDNSLTTYKTIWALFPELTLVVVAATIYTVGAFQRARDAWNSLAILGLVAAGVFLVAQYSLAIDEASDVTGPITLDYYSYALRWLALGLGGLVILGAWHAGNPGLGSEYVGSLLLTTVGVMLVASARDLVLLFLGLELISIPTYVLLFLGRRNRGSAEATAKYFYLSILSSALLLYGFSLVYGASGTTRLDSLTAAVVATPETGVANLLPIALLLVVAGFGFKLAAAPFHFYAPDVYQGTTSINAGILAVVPKVAGLVALIRFVLALPPDQFALAWQLLVTLSLVTMTVGNVSALWQTNVRRLLAFSSIAHSGYMLIGVAVALASVRLPGESAGGGVAAALFYVVVYALASFGSFAALAWLGASDREVNDLDELAGLSKSQPLAAAALAVFMFSLAGIPPLAGFWGKLYLFKSGIGFALPHWGDPAGMWFTVLLIAAALNAATAAAYYLRFIAALYFSSEPETLVPARGGGGAMAAALLSALLVLVGGIVPGLLADQTELSEGAAVTTASRKPERVPAAAASLQKARAEATQPVPAEVKSPK